MCYLDTGCPHPLYGNVHITQWKLVWTGTGTDWYLMSTSDRLHTVGCGVCACVCVCVLHVYTHRGKQRPFVLKKVPFNNVGCFFNHLHFPGK